MVDPKLPDTTELGELQLRLRDDLDFSMREYVGEKYYIVEDRARCRFYQIGVAEYTFISLLDGETPLTEALRLTSTRLGPNAFSEQNAVSIVKWLVDSELVFTADSTRTERLLKTAETAQQRKQATRLNPILLKVPLLNPERLLDALTPWFGWMTSRIAMLGWLLLCALAVVQLLDKGQAVFAAADQVVDRSNWLWLAVTWMALRFFHELGHALTCRKYGGHVRDFGVMLILLIPIPYVNVTSSWRFASKWQRIATSAAGMYVELGIAAIAALVWCHAEHALVRHHAYNIMLLASVTTFLFNANFLMRFDGYYLLADWLEVPNLYSLGQQYLSYFGRRYLLGVRLDPPRHRRGINVRLYGAASLLWRVLVCACLVISAEALLFGFGLILSIVGVLFWLAVPLYRFAAYLLDRENTERISHRRFAIVVAAATTLLIMSFTVIRWPGRASAPAIVQYAKAKRIHTEAAGIVRTVHVQPGQDVQQGQILLELFNAELETQLRDLELSIEQTRVRSRLHHLQQQLGAYQAEEAALESLERKAVELRAQVAALHVRAPMSGKIVGRDLQNLVDRYLSLGTEILTIADEAAKEIVLSIHQDDIAHFRLHVGKAVTVCSMPPVAIECKLDAVEPGASDEVSHAALIAPAAGPIAVRPCEMNDSAEPGWRYLHPRFEGTAKLSVADCQELRIGQRVRVKLTVYDQTFGVHVYRIVRDWVREKLLRKQTA